MPTSDNLQDDAYTRVVDFLRAIESRRVQSDVAFRPFVGVKTTEVRTQLQGGFSEPASGKVGSPGGVGSGPTGDLEEVTGAVNGVPATLNVMTDGEGWTAI